MKKKHIIIGSILVIGAIMVGSTLAQWTWSTSSNEQTNVVVTVGGITINYEDGENITNNNLIPTSTKEKGISKDITVSSTGQVYLDLNMDVVTLDDGLKDASFKYEIYNGDTLVKSSNFWLRNVGDNLSLLSDVTINSTPVTYTLYIWIDGNLENSSTMYNKNFEFRLNAEVTDEIPISLETLRRLGLTYNEGTPDFSQAAITDEGIYSAQDDYGTSYYFRGAVENNYVQFAGFYWRVIRINGDGSIRMIYDGTSAHANGESSEDRQIGTGSYNDDKEDNAYIGYMYGTPNSSTYEETHANENESIIKAYVDSWYKTNIEDAEYSQYVADVIYCNDRSLNSGNGYGTNETYYSAYNRLNTNNSPVLTCTNKNDGFTVDDTINGNGALTYPVGLITVDEIVMGGGHCLTSNGSYYLYTGQFFLTISPYSVQNGNSRMWNLLSGGFPYLVVVGVTRGVRPVISLKSIVEFTGNGTMESPFEVVN